MVLYASKKTGMFDNLPQLNRFSNVNLDWFNQIYPPGINLIPEKYRDEIRRNLNQVLVEMSEPFPLESTDLENPPYSSGTSDEMKKESIGEAHCE
jgi:hypothetical protein